MRSFLVCILCLMAYHGYGQSEIEWLLLAEKRLSLGDTTAAINSFSRALEKNPANPAGAIRLAEVYREIQEFDKALLYINTAGEILDEKRQSEEINAVRNRLNWSSETKEIYQTKINQLSKTEAITSHVKGTIFKERGQLTNAYNAFYEAYQLDSSNLEIVVDLGLISFSSGHVLLSKKFMNRAIELSPDNPYVLFNFANIHSRLQEYEKAIIAYKRAAELDSTLILPHLYLGDIYFEKEQYDSAIYFYTHYSARDSLNEKAFFKSALAHYQLGHKQDAIDNWLSVVKINDENVDAHLNIGLTFSEIKKYDQAIIHFNQTISLAPDKNAAYMHRGHALSQMGQHKEAKTDLDYTIKILPKYAYGYYYRALHYQKTNKRKKSCRDLNKALALGLSNEQVDDSLLFFCQN
ncbi:MAG: tetratricopeptide repeat protein [Bacteroidota bacterium]